MQQQSLEGKAKIKERFNQLAQQVNIDTKELVQALLKKKDVKCEKKESNDNLNEEKDN